METKILSGSTSIGGNFIRIEDGDQTIIFDQGIRLDLMSRYYSRRRKRSSRKKIRGIDFG
ncbi:MAG: hypothetical protein QXX95_01980 [Nitrososphaerales archaeon]